MQIFFTDTDILAVILFLLYTAAAGIPAAPALQAFSTVSTEKHLVLLLYSFPAAVSWNDISVCFIKNFLCDEGLVVVFINNPLFFWLFYLLFTCINPTF